MDYKRISQKEAKRILDSGEECTLLDVREETEFDEGHIPGAKLLPLGDVTDIAEDELPDKDAAILVYCRSGRRSKMAAAILCSLGYTDVREFGGILDWPYEIEK